MRDKSGAENALVRATQVRLRLVDGALILAFLSVFIGLVLLLSK